MDTDSPFTEEEMAMLRPVFIASGREHLVTMAQLQPELTAAVPDGEALKRFHRAIHSLKGAALQMGFLQIGGLARMLERLVLVLQGGLPDDQGQWETLLQRGSELLEASLTATEQQAEFTPEGALMTDLEAWLTQWEPASPGEQRATG